MNSTKDSAQNHPNRKSDIFSPSLKESGTLYGDGKSANVTSNTPNRSREHHKKKRDLKGEFEQLHTPLMPGQTRRGTISRDQNDLNSSMNSSAHFLNTRRNNFHRARIIIIIMMLLQIITCGAQIYFFTMLIKYINHNCLTEYILGWVMAVLSAFGILLALCGILATGTQRFSRYCRRTAIFSTAIVVFYVLAVVGLVAIVHYNDPLPRCTNDEQNNLLNYTYLWIILLATLIVALIGVVLDWKMIRDAKRIDELERYEQEKEDLISRVAQDLAEN